VAEIKVTTSSTRKTVTGKLKPIAEQVDEERHTVVRSSVADRMTAWHLRDFVKALDAANVPDKTLLEASHGENYHLTGLMARFSVTLDQEEPQPRAVAQS
jgi:predicted transcriptional regulator